MKNIVTRTVSIAGIALSLLFSACDDYLSTIPKGEKVPETFKDYNAFIAYNENHLHDNLQQTYLLNDMFCTASRLNSYELMRINYMWDENADRKVQDNQMMLSSGTATYAYCYQGIAHWNLIIENANKVTECTQQQREQLKAQGKVLRIMDYFHLANYYADQYTKENAKTTLSVPLLLSANVESTSPQVTIEKMYEFILGDLTEETIQQLPDKGETFLHPTKGSGYAMLARIYLQMDDYENALKYAEKALAINSTLYDWRSYYLAHKSDYDAPGYGTTSYPAVTLTNPENYVYSFCSSMYSRQTVDIPVERATRFNSKDLRLLTKWKFQKNDAGDRYTSIRADYVNWGLSTPEMYYIKAECLARKGQLQDAMDALNAVRITRFLPEDYTPFTASTKKEAIKYIQEDKANEYIQTSIPFWDMRRLNKDPEYATTLDKVVKGVKYTLKPDSHLWIMPFSEKIMTNPGNNPIQQNTPR